MKVIDDKAQYYISKLQLAPHPEGGYFKEIYRSSEIYEEEYLPERYSGKRNFATSIYFMLAGNDVSNFHCLKSDEIWHFYDGSSIVIYLLNKMEGLKKITLGKNLINDEVYQTTIKRGDWFAAELKDKNSFSLIGCTVSPGFDFKDFELAKRNFLSELFPGYESLIKRFTKE